VQSKSPRSTDERIVYEMRGKTMTVYLYLLKHGGASGSSEIQKGLGFSSVSVAVHHLEKLIQLGVVERGKNGDYQVIRRVEVGVLAAFLTIGPMILPRLGFYAGLSTVLTIFYVVSERANINPYGLILGLFATVALWYETLRIWKGRPR
jgi:hypothetical protein